MEKYVIKRNGGYRPFEEFKIKDAIEKSFNSVQLAIDEKVVSSVFEQLQSKTT